MINFPFLPVEGLHEFNLDWFLHKFKELYNEYKDFEKTIAELREEIKTFEEDLQKSFNDLIDYVDNYFKNLNITEEVESIIDDMMARGEFDIFFKPIILYVNAEGRNIKRLYAYGEDAVSPDTYGVGAEGFCRHLNNWYQCFKSRNDSVANIAVFNNNFEQISISDNLTTLGHANSMFYADGLLFIATINHGIAVVDAETLQLVTNIVCPTPTCNGVGIDNGIYYYTDYSYVYSFTFDRNTSESSFNLETDLRGHFDRSKCQGFDVYKDNYYILQSGSEVLLRYNKFGDFINQYIITSFKNFIGEVQDLQISDDGEVVINSTTRYPYYQYTYTYYYKTDLTGLVKIEKPVFNVIPQDTTIYVNKNNYQKKPTGKANSPFNTISEALIHIVNAENYDTPYTINLQSNDHSEEIVYINGLNVRIAPDGLSDRIKIKALLLNNCKFTMNFCDIENDSGDFLALYILNSDVNLINMSSYNKYNDGQNRKALMYLSTLFYNNLQVTDEAGGVAESTYSTITGMTNNPFTNGTRSLNIIGELYNYPSADRPTLTNLHTETNPLIIPIPDFIQNKMKTAEQFQIFAYMSGSVNRGDLNAIFNIKNLTDYNIGATHTHMFYIPNESNVKLTVYINLTPTEIQVYSDFRDITTNEILTYERSYNIYRFSQMFCK